MYFVDYHMHSHFSEDSKEPISEICKKAVEIGLDEIAITDHMEIFKNKPYTYIINVEGLFEELAYYKRKYEGKLIIRQGIEIGQPFLNPEETNKFYKNYKPDFMLCSLHSYGDTFGDITAEDFSNIDCYEFYGKYLDNLIHMSKECDYDTLGHLTYPLRYMLRDHNIRLDLSAFYPKFKELFEVVVDRKKGIEVNTSGFKILGEPLPNLDIVKLYRECGGEILTIGSDSHNKDGLGYKIKDTYSNLKEIGFTHITTFDQREPIFKEI